MEMGGSYARTVTPIFNNNTATCWVQATMKLCNLTHFGVVYHSQKADSTAGGHTPMRGCHSSCYLDDILPRPVKDMMDDLVEQSNDDGETWHPHSRSSPTTKTDFQKFELKFHKRINW
jgi:hypothetical protein